MASVKLKYRPSVIPGREGSIYYQIIHERKIRQLTTPYHIHPSEWNAKTAGIDTYAGSERYNYLFSAADSIARDMECLHRIIKNLDGKGMSYTADDIIEKFKANRQEGFFFAYMSSAILRLRQKGKARTAETYVSALNSFRQFRGNEDILLGSITSEVMESYQAYLQVRRVTPNTISFYMRILRAVYNRGVENELTEQRNPFRHVYTGVDKTIKRALPVSIIKRIKNVDLSDNPVLDYARDMFMLSFYFRGMSFVDMAYLRKSDLQRGVIVYRRRKTMQQLSIRWTDEMQAILDKYPGNDSEYLLPIIRRNDGDVRKHYLNARYNINRGLKKLSEVLRINCNLTMYVSRHSWASIAKAKGVPLGVISEGLGHESESTTRIYLASLSNSVVDKANKLILSSL